MPSVFREVKSPHSLEAERAILGSILLDNTVLDIVAQSIGTDDFFSEANRITFRKMLELYQAGKPIELITLNDELGNEDLLTKIGGATYLAALTDGIPMGNAMAVASYVRIVKEHSVRRRIINAANNVISRTFEGVDDPGSLLVTWQLEAEEIAVKNRNGSGHIEVAQTEEEKAEEAKSVEQIAHDWSLCPHVPDAAWYGYSRAYRDLIGPVTEPSDNYHLACFISVMGAAVGRCPFIMTPDISYANFYTVITGPSAWASKGTAIRSVMRLMPVSPLISRIGSINSAEGVLKKLQSEFNTNEELRKGGVLVVEHEFNKILRKARAEGSTIIQSIKNWYDWIDRWENNSLTCPINIINPPTISILASSEIDDLDDITPRDLKGGFGNRFMWVAGDPKSPNADSKIPAEGEWAPLLETLKKIVSVWHKLGPTEITWSQPAHERWRKFYARMRERGADDPKVYPLAARQRTIIPRLALLWAALDAQETIRTREIKLEHLEASIAWADFQLQGLYYIFRGVGLTPWAKDEEDMVDFVRQYGSAPNQENNFHPRGGVDTRRLQQRFIRQCQGSENYNRMMKNLVYWPGADSPQHADRRLRGEERPSKRGRKTRWICLNI